MNKLVGLNHNDTAAERNLLRGRVISKKECLGLVPGIREQGLTGGVIVYDCQMSNSERLVLDLARSASQTGADLANYVEATGLLMEHNHVAGIKARDVLSGDRLDVTARLVVNASGPWADGLVGAVTGRSRSRRAPLSKAFNLLINRQLIADNAVGIYSRGRFQDRDAILDKGSRLLFITPWQHRSLVGTAHLPYAGDPDQFQVSSAEIQDFIDEINDAYPSADIRPEQIEHVYGGLLPAANDAGIQLLRQHRIDDHCDVGIDGFLSVTGVKFTEARIVAEEAVNAIFRKLGHRPPKSTTAVTPVYGGRMERFDKFVSEETRQAPHHLGAGTVRALIAQYGSAYSELVKYQSPGESGEAALDMVRAEILYGIREEMAQTLADIVFRRTMLALPGKLTDGSLEFCAGLMAQELGWNEERVRREMVEVRASCGAGRIRSAEAA